MKQSCVSAFARAARLFALAAVALGFGAGVLHAQATGKIEGRVRDQAGAPIANAQVFIVGTSFNALTNPQGYYFMNNVPSGTYQVRAAFIGYKSTQVDGVRVLAGQTLTTDVQLEQTAVQIDEITVVTQTQPLVPRDEVSTKQRVDGSFTDQLPVDQINQVLSLQPGVTSNASGTGISIRGGRQDETATYVDGVPVQAGNRGMGFVVAGSGGGNGGGNGAGISGGGGGGFSASGGTQIQVGTNAFEEASVTTGASSAEFGNAQSGILQIATKTGSATGFNGNFGYESDEPFGKGTSVGFNRFQAGVGGPLGRGLTFWLSGILEGRKSQDSGLNATDYPIFTIADVDTIVDVVGVATPVYNFAVSRGECSTFEGSASSEIANNFGQDCNGIRIPNSNSSGYQASAKLNYSYGTGSRVALSALASQNQGRIFNYGDLYNFQAEGPGVDRVGARSWNRVYTLNWTQNLTKSTERALALDVALSYQTDRFNQSPLEGDFGTGTLGFYLKPVPLQWDFESFPLNEELLSNYRNNVGRRSPYDLANRDQYEETDRFRNNAYGLSGSFSEAGGSIARLYLNQEDRYVGKANLDWQVDRYNRVKLGGEFTRYDIFSYAHLLNDQFFSDVFHEKPVRQSAFIEDRLDLGDVVLVGGLRYDRYDSRASRPSFVCTDERDLDDTVDDGFCGGAATGIAVGQRIRAFRISSNPNFTEGDVGSIDELYVRDEAHDYVSPHIQVSFPVTDRTNFRLSYAHQVQAPDFGLVLGGINTDLNITNTNHVFGSDLDFGKTITFEFGIRHAFSDDMVLDLAAYNKDNLANPAGRLVSSYDPFTQRSQDVRMMTNADFGNTRGIDVRLDRRFGSLFNGTVAYSYQQAKNTGNDPFTYINFGSRIINQISGGNQPPPQAIAPTTTSRPHSLSGAVSLTFPNDWRQGTTVGNIMQNFGVFATFRYASGTAYTICTESGATGGNESVISGEVCAKGNFEGGLNTGRLPAWKQLDMRFTKGFSVGGFDLTAYLDARNILNLRNVLAVFVDTRDVVNQTEADRAWRVDSTNYFVEADNNGVVGEDGEIDLTFGGQGRSGCAGWVDEDELSSAPNCLYMLQAEQRWGDGDGIFTLDEQRTASEAFYLVGQGNQGINQDAGSINAGRGLNNFTAPGRRLRLGLELNF